MTTATTLRLRGRCFVLFDVDAGTGEPLAALEARRPDVARLLRAETGELSSEQVADACAARLSYAPGEACFVDWLAALVVGRDTADERTVLEHATVELLELRVLAEQLTAGVEDAYRALARPRVGLRALGPGDGSLERIARVQADDAVLHETIDNALELFGDDYLARVYRLAATRLHFADWDTSIQRKLGVLDSIHGKLAAQQAHRRAELLEWIIIVLIAVDILVYFALPHG